MKRKPIICQMRRTGTMKITANLPNGVVHRNLMDDTIIISWLPRRDDSQFLNGLTSRDARLLAKRINEFLDFGG